MLKSKQKGLQTYSGDTFLSLEPAVGGQIWSENFLTNTIPNNLYLAKDAWSKQKGLQTYSWDTFLSLEPAVGVRSENL